MIGWKEYPSNKDVKFKYTVDKENPKIATKTGDGYCCTVIGNTPLPLGTITACNIKILKSSGDKCADLFIGIAPADIDQTNKCNRFQCGWYFHCQHGKLISGPPHYFYLGKRYGPQKESGKYLRTGETISIVMDTTNGDLSFVLNGVDYGVAYEGIPLDKPLVPCAILNYWKDSVELDLSEVKMREPDSSIPVPSNITAKSEACGSITVNFDAVNGASFYQAKADESRIMNSSTGTELILEGLPPGRPYNVRVRAVKGNTVGPWSEPIKEFAQKILFRDCKWKKCPEYVSKSYTYDVNPKTPKIATKPKVGQCCCTVIGDMPFQPNTTTTFWIRIVKSAKNDGRGTWIGVVPHDVDQNSVNGAGWFLNCFNSKLNSGAPQNYNDKEYGVEKKDGKYVRKGSIIGVTIDTAKGELSYTLDGVNQGIAFEGIPVNRPLVPCVSFNTEGDSVELITSEEEMESAEKKGEKNGFLSFVDSLKSHF